MSRNHADDAGRTHLERKKKNLKSQQLKKKGSWAERKEPQGHLVQVWGRGGVGAKGGKNLTPTGKVVTSPNNRGANGGKNKKIG